MRSSPVARYVRANKETVSVAWERRVVAEHPVLAGMEREVLLDHLPEVLDGLADWIEGETVAAERAFAALADGHALQRLGFGVELAILNAEYTSLRGVLLTHLLEVPPSRDVTEDLISLNAGLDRAIDLSVRRYAEGRELLRDRFVGILGHDLRDPLHAIDMASRMLLRSGTLGEGELQRAAVIERAAARMSRMIRDVLDFARGRLGGGIPCKPIECDMGEICRLVAEEARSSHPDRRIDLRLAGDLMGTFDPDRTLQAMGNLVTNAVKHASDPIVISASESDDERSLLTTVTSHGRPIPAEVAASLFDPFTRSGDSLQGLGLGLYIVAQVVRAHGGTCTVDSTSERTVFGIRWPRTPRQETPGRP